MLECSSLSPAENAAVLATSGATTKEGGSIGNSYLHVDLAASFIALWDNEALMRTETYASHCRCSNDDVGSIFPVECFFLEQDTVDGGEWETALGTYDEPWEDQSWEEPEEAQALTTTGQMSSYQRTQSWKINLDFWKQRRPMQWRSSRMLRQT